MTLFAEIDDKLLELVHKLAKGRKIIDCGAGECMFEYKYKQKYPKSDVTSIEMFPENYDNFYIDEDDIMKINGIYYPFADTDFPIFIRPCHSQQFMPAILDKAKKNASEALYISNPRNIQMDIQDYTYYIIPGYVGKNDDENIFLLKLNDKEYIEQEEEEWYWTKISDHWTDYIKLKKIVRNGEPWLVNNKGGGMPMKLIHDYKKIEESNRYVKLYEEFNNKNKLRLITTFKCDKNCKGCCNNDDIWQQHTFQPVEHYNYDDIYITGGEPMLFADKLKKLIKDIRQSDAKIIIYTANCNDLETFIEIADLVDGITFTLHRNKDIPAFEKLNDYLTENYHKKQYFRKSFRLNSFSEVDITNMKLNKKIWKVKDNIDWITNAPLPQGEEILTLKKLW